MQTIICIVAGASVFLALSVSAAEKKPLPLTVCELLARRNEYNQRMVEVRGEVRFGGHGAYLVASRDCQFGLVTRGVAWPNYIYMEYPATWPPPTKEDPVQFKADMKSVRKADAAVRRSGFDGQTDQLIETYVGFFTTYLDLENRVNPGIPPYRLGFGPAGLGAPAQLVVQSEKDVLVVHGDGTRPHEKQR